MTTYKELADRLTRVGHYVGSYDAIDEAAAILRSLDAQPVAEVSVMGSYHGKPILGCVLSSDSMQVGDKLYAAPVAAVRKAMARLADLLDEDKFMEIEGIFTSAGFTPPVAAQASKPLSDAEIESGVPMHRKGSIAFRDGVRWAEQRHGIKERG